MSPKSKSTPSRPPLKAKSSLPAPRVAPKRVHVPWYRRRPLQILLGLVVLLAAFIVISTGLRTWHRHQATMRAKKGVQAFDAMYKSAITPLGNFLTQVNNTPQQFAGGLMPQATYVSQTAQWLATFRALSGQLSSASPPHAIQGARGLLLQGTAVFIDGIKVFQAAGATTDTTQRKDLVDLGRTIIFHATSVFKNATVEEAKVVAAFHLQIGAPPSALLELPDAPAEVAPPAPAVSPVPSPP